MKTSILQLLDDQPLRLVAPESPKAASPIASPGCRGAEAVALSECHSLRPLLLSTLMFLLTWWALIHFGG